MIGLVKPLVQNFKSEESLQAAIQTIELVRSTCPKGKKDGKTKNYHTKAELQRIKPSDMLARVEVEEEEEEEEVEVEAPPDDALDLF